MHASLQFYSNINESFENQFIAVITPDNIIPLIRSRSIEMSALKVSLVCLFVNEYYAAIIVPKISSVQHPPVPDNYFIPNKHSLSDRSVDPELTPGLYQGDIAIDNEMHNVWKVGLLWDAYPERLWVNNTVPYYISPLYDPADQAIILKALRTLNFMTCIRFVPWNGRSKDFLLIWPIKYPKGCWSYVGKIGGPQIVSLQAPSGGRPNCLGSEGRAIHELMHALGIFHEQSRADRDDFVTVHWQNIEDGYENNFEKQSLKNTTYTFEYDYESIMHYGRNYFRFVMIIDKSLHVL